MKRTYYIEQIKNTGLKINFIAEKLRVHRTALSSFLHGSRQSALTSEQVSRLDALLDRYQY